MNKKWIGGDLQHKQNYCKYSNNPRMNVIEEFAEYIGGREEIWYATNIEICDYVAAYNQLQFATDGSKVYNPTAITLYFESAGVSYCVVSFVQ